MKRLTRIGVYTVLALGIVALVREPTSSQDLTPEQLEKLRGLYSKARENYQAEKYAESNKAYSELLGILPASTSPKNDRTRSTVYYDMACNFAMLKQNVDSLSHLKKAVASGFRNHEYLQQDTSLSGIWKEKGFQAIVDEIKTLQAKDLEAVATIPFGLKDLDGKELKKEEFEGKVLILDVWGTWCPPCRMEIPHFIELQKKYKGQGLEVIGLTWEQRPPDENVRKKVQAFAKQNKVNYRMALLTPDKLSAIPDLTGFPTTFFVDRNLTVRKRVVGYHDLTAIEEEVKPLLAEKKADAKK